MTPETYLIRLQSDATRLAEIAAHDLDADVPPCPGWTVRDVVAHLGTWLAEAQVQLVKMAAGTYEGHDVDIDALNAALLEAMDGQPWEVAWVQANAARTRMLAEWYGLRTPTDEAAWWIRKAAADHYGEHLPRLAAWVAELVARRR